MKLGEKGWTSSKTEENGLTFWDFNLFYTQLFLVVLYYLKFQKIFNGHLLKK